MRCLKTKSLIKHFYWQHCTQRKPAGI